MEPVSVFGIVVLGCVAVWVVAGVAAMVMRVRRGENAFPLDSDWDDSDSDFGGF
tara:strand:+ start:312 stop:473 length:162 start_codon:yes stop_codon:yes gene_type:complete